MFNNRLIKRLGPYWIAVENDTMTKRTFSVVLASAALAGLSGSILPTLEEESAARATILLCLQLFGLISCLFLAISTWRTIKLMKTVRNTEHSWPRSCSYMEFVKLTKHYQVSSATGQDLTQVVSMGKRYIGDNHPSEATLTKRQEKCPDIVTTVRDASTGALAGYTIIYPVSKSGLERLISSRIQTAKGFRHTDLVSSFRAAKALYVSMVCADPKGPSKRYVKTLLEKQLEVYCIEGKRIEFIFAKPSSPGGWHFVKRWGMTQLAGNNSNLFKLQIKRMSSYPIPFNEEVDSKSGRFTG